MERSGAENDRKREGWIGEVRRDGAKQERRGRMVFLLASMVWRVVSASEREMEGVIPASNAGDWIQQRDGVHSTVTTS